MLNIVIPNTSGIYKIECSANSKVYVGSAKNLYNRKYEHFKRLRKGNHCNVHLQRSFNKHGEASFVFKVIELCGLDELISREQFHIDAIPARLKMNIAPKAGNTLGISLSQEARDKISRIHLGDKRKPESIQRQKDTVYELYGGDPKRKPVVQFDKTTGLTIATYASATEAEQHTAVSRVSICRICTKASILDKRDGVYRTLKSAGGYGWRFATDPLPTQSEVLKTAADHTLPDWDWDSYYSI